MKYKPKTNETNDSLVLNKWLNEVAKVEYLQIIDHLENEPYNFMRLKNLDDDGDYLNIHMITTRENHKNSKANDLKGLKVRDFIRNLVLKPLPDFAKSKPIKVRLYLHSFLRKKSLLYEGKLSVGDLEYYYYER